MGEDEGRPLTGACGEPHNAPKEATMGRETVRISAKDHRRLQRRLDVLLAATATRPDEYDRVCNEIEAICTRLGIPRVAGPAQTEPRVSMAEVRRDWYRTWFHGLGLSGVIPPPDASNREYERRRAAGQELFCRPASSAIFYKEFMTACGYENHWSVAGVYKGAKIGFEDASKGYWFWADVSEPCPRLGTSWNDLMKSTTLLSLEEYAIVWYAHKAATGVLLGHRSGASWLRTRYGRGALSGSGDDGSIHVGGSHKFAYLSVPFSGMGGRSAEEVKNAA